jgi:transcriptional regulator with XRE-family HTH domain
MVAVSTEPNISTIVAANVRHCAESRGLTVSDLSLALGLGERAFRRRWEGTTPYTLEELARVASLFEIPWSELAKHSTPTKGNRR